MNKEYGGKQKKLRDTFMEHADGYLGPFSSRILNVGDTQHFTYDSSDIGPFYLTEIKRLEEKFDRVVAGRTKEGRGFSTRPRNQ